MPSNCPPRSPHPLGSIFGQFFNYRVHRSVIFLRTAIPGCDPPGSPAAAERQQGERYRRREGSAATRKNCRIGGLEQVIRRGGDQYGGHPGSDGQWSRATRRDAQDKGIDIGGPNDCRQPVEAGFAELGPDPGGGQRDHYEQCRENEGGGELQWICRRFDSRLWSGWYPVPEVPKPGQNESGEAEHKKRRGERGGKWPVENRDDDQ